MQSSTFRHGRSDVKIQDEKHPDGSDWLGNSKCEKVLRVLVKNMLVNSMIQWQEKLMAFKAASTEVQYIR